MIQENFNPKISKDLGFIYPIVFRILNLRWWPSGRLKKDNRLFVDIYLTCFFYSK